jgi:hypothetical protein
VSDTIKPWCTYYVHWRGEGSLKQWQYISAYYQSHILAYFKCVNLLLVIVSIGSMGQWLLWHNEIWCRQYRFVIVVMISPAYRILPCSHPSSSETKVISTKLQHRSSVNILNLSIHTCTFLWLHSSCRPFQDISTFMGLLRQTTSDVKFKSGSGAWLKVNLFVDITASKML